MITLGTPRPTRRLGLTPMIDVVFLLIVFFMLAAQFGIDRVLPLNTGGVDRAYTGPPRLVVISENGILLNGAPVSLEQLPEQVATLTQSKDDTVVLQPVANVPLQRLLDVAEALNASGFSRLAVVD